MVEFFTQLLQYFQLVADSIRVTLTGLVTAISMIPSWLVWLSGTAVYLPSFLFMFLVVGISLTLLFRIIKF